MAVDQDGAGEPNWIGWACGVLGPVLIIAGFFAIDAGGTTPADGEASRLVADLVRDPERRLVGTVVGVLGGLLLPLFGEALFLRFASHARTRVGALAAFGFVVLVVAGVLLHGALRVAVGAVHDPAVLGEAVRVLAVLAPTGLVIISWSAIGLVAVTAVAGLRQRLLPSAWSAIGLVLAGAAAAFSTSDRGGFTLALMPWIAVTSAILWAGQRRALSGSPDRRNQVS